MSVRAVNKLNLKFEKNVIGKQRSMIARCKKFSRISDLLVKELVVCMDMQVPLPFYTAVQNHMDVLRQESKALKAESAALKSAGVQHNEEIEVEEIRFRSSSTFGPGIWRWTAERQKICVEDVIEGMSLDFNVVNELYGMAAIKFWH